MVWHDADLSPYGEIETNFESFLISDVESSLHRAAFASATASRSTGWNNPFERLPALPTSVIRRTSCHLAEAVCHGGQGLNHLDTKGTAGEGPGMNKGGWGLKPWSPWARYQGLCNPGLSFSSYALPTLNISQGILGSVWLGVADVDALRLLLMPYSHRTIRPRETVGCVFFFGIKPSVPVPRSIVPHSMTLDGLGFDPVPIRTAYLVAKEHDLHELFLPTGYDPDISEGAPALRSLFRFRFVVGTARDPVQDRIKASKIVDSNWETFFKDVLVPALRSSDMVTSFKDDMHVWFDGTSFRDFEVHMAVVNDVPLAIGSAIFILAYMLAHTRSLLLSLVGPLLAMLSVPVTFIISGALLGNSTVNFANFLAVFLAIGFGADVMFVYYDAWTQSEAHAEKVSNRLAWTYRRAVKASLATTSTTALSFLCNMASVIRALRQFGFFMGICVLITWLSLTFIYVPTIVIDHVWCRRVRLSTRKLSGSKSRCFGTWALVLHRIRYCILFITLVFIVVCVALALPALTVGTGMPDVFPAQHNQNTGVEVLSQFEPVSSAFATSRQNPPRDVQVCLGSDFTRSTDDCVMQWCEARFVNDVPAWEGNGTCTCKRRMTLGCSGTSAPVRIRLVGPDSLTDLQLSLHLVDHLFAWPNADSLTLGIDARRELIEEQKSLPQLLQQVWDTGETSLNSVLEINAAFTRSDGDSCGWDELCFCGGGGSLQCILDSWGGTMNFDLPPVRAVFGIVPTTTVMLLGERPPEEMWAYNDKFDLSDPWSQRAMCLGGW
eukprot:Skav209825  [mRNA]  locus=scaffold2703:25777:34242:+ [translate_table: standard]